MSNVEKQEKILNDLKRRAEEEVRNGDIIVKLKIQDGVIVAGEIMEQKIKLG